MVPSIRLHLRDAAANTSLCGDRDEERGSLRTSPDEINAFDFRVWHRVFPSTLEQPNGSSLRPTGFVRSSPGDHKLFVLFIGLVPPVRQIAAHDDGYLAGLAVRIMDDVAADLSPILDVKRVDGGMKEVQSLTR